MQTSIEDIHFWRLIWKEEIINFKNCFRCKQMAWSNQIALFYSTIALLARVYILFVTYLFSPSGGVYDGGVYTGGPPYDRTSGGGDHMLYGSTYNTNGSVYNGYTITPLNNNKEFPQVLWPERI